MDVLFKIAYFAGMVLEVVLRAPYARLCRKKEKADRRVDFSERFVLAALFLGTLLLPLVFALTPWLESADYRTSSSAEAILGFLGVLVMAAAVTVFWRAHRDLGAYWSPSLEIHAGHQLVTSGIYGSVRHPMYLSLLLWGIAQAPLLHNWMAGPASVPVFVLARFVRVPREERMMLDHFGQAYADYAARVGSVLPRFGRRGVSRG